MILHQLLGAVVDRPTRCCYTACPQVPLPWDWRRVMTSVRSPGQWKRHPSSPLLQQMSGGGAECSLVCIEQ
jgi:hypothetical protein